MLVFNDKVKESIDVNDYLLSSIRCILGRSTIRIRRRVHCLAFCLRFARGLELSPKSLVMTLAPAVTLAQNHEHTLIILSKIFLAGLHDLLISATSS